MPIFIAALLGGFATAIGSLVGRVLIALGITYVSYQGLDVLLTGIKGDIFSNLGGLSGQVLGIVGVLQVDTAINIIFSAIAARMVVAGLTSGVITRRVIK